MEDEREVKKLIGLYTGLVTDNADPLVQGRVKVSIPNVMDTPSTGWALPGATGGAGTFGRGISMTPKIGAQVDVQFVMGDPRVPRYYMVGNGQAGALSHILNPPNGAVDPKDAWLLWGWEGERFALQVDERPGKEYIRFLDKKVPENSIEIDGAMGITSLGAISAVILLSEKGAVAMGAKNISANGRPCDNTTIDPW